MHLRDEVNSRDTYEMMVLQLIERISNGHFVIIKGVFGRVTVSYMGRTSADGRKFVKCGAQNLEGSYLVVVLAGVSGEGGERQTG